MGPGHGYLVWYEGCRVPANAETQQEVPCFLLQGVQKKRPWDAQSALLRRHLLELTQSFIIPLVRQAGCASSGGEVVGVSESRS